MMFFLCFLSYTPLAMGIHDTAVNVNATNAIWVFMDSFFGLFWTTFVILWLMLALYFIIGEM